MKLERDDDEQALATGYTGSLRARFGSSRDDAEFPPDIVFDASGLPDDAKLYWYARGRPDEHAGLYVSAFDGRVEFWWWGVDEQQARTIAEQASDAILEADFYEDLVDALKRLGGR